MKKTHIIMIGAALLLPFAIQAQEPQKPGPGPTTEVVVEEADSVLVTIILKHQQDKNLPEIRRILEKQGFWDIFPPEDARVLSWNIAMGLGHVIVLKIPAGSVRYLNVALENSAWGAFNTEFYLSYDYMGIWEDYLDRRSEAKAEKDE